VRVSIEYIAGFFDGEGSIGIYSRKDRTGGFCLTTQLTQNVSNEVIQIIFSLQHTYGGNVSYQKTLSGNTKVNWQLSSNKAMEFLKVIEPHLILKREQALIAINFQENRQPVTRDSNGRIRGLSEESILSYVKAAEQIKKLKHPSQNIDEVMANQADLVTPIVKLRPLAVVKG
jgi:hypothetical protein